MEKPLCKICDPPRRHWSGDDHKFADGVAAGEVAVASVAVTNPSMIVMAGDPVVVGPPRGSVGIPRVMIDPVPVATVDDEWAGCPYCAERKAAHAERMKRYRAKRLRPMTDAELKETE